MSTPAPGTVVLYDDVAPPLAAGSYRVLATTTVAVGGADHELGSERHFEVDAPRFALPPSEIAALHPPRNGHGAFHETLPHIVLRRRTLPWERALDPGGRIPAPARPPGETAPRGLTPWMALLLFDEGEARLLEGLPLEQVVPPDVFQRLGVPAGVRCDAVEVERSLLADLLPSLDELRLLAHVRQVETDNRPLDAGDGWFSVVVSNRLPRAGARHLACLVSLEERSDLVTANAPPVDTGGRFGDVAVVSGMMAAERAAPPARRGGRPIRFPPIWSGPPRLVVLTSWSFEGGDATFAQLMRGLDVGLFGARAEAGEPPLTDTGHLPIRLEDRAGEDQTAWYRSPLVPHELARDALGPYHTADQARRVSPETGAEDITYAAAFEVGRLVCVADSRAAAELLRWRRVAYRTAARGSTLDRAAQALRLDPALATLLGRAPAPVLSVAALERAAGVGLARADVSGLSATRPVGLDPDALADAWALPSRARAEALLTAQPLPLAPVPVPPRRPPVHAPDPGSLARIAELRERLLEADETPRDPR